MQKKKLVNNIYISYSLSSKVEKNRQLRVSPTRHSLEKSKKRKPFFCDSQLFKYI